MKLKPCSLVVALGLRGGGGTVSLACPFVNYERSRDSQQTGAHVRDSNSGDAMCAPERHRIEQKPPRKNERDDHQGLFFVCPHVYREGQTTAQEERSDQEQDRLARHQHHVCLLRIKLRIDDDADKKNAKAKLGKIYNAIVSALKDSYEVKSGGDKPNEFGFYTIMAKKK